MLEPIDPVEGNAADEKKKISLAAAHKMFAHINVESPKKMIEREGHEVINDYKIQSADRWAVRSHEKSLRGVVLLSCAQGSQVQLSWCRHTTKGPR